MSKRIGSMLLAVGLLCGGAGSGALAQKPKVQPGSARSSKPGPTLHERARKAGGTYVLTYRPNNATVYPNVEELAKRSELIVIGRILSHQTKVTDDEQFIFQDYQIKVQELVKGDLPRGSALTVSLPGGKHRFADGTYVAVMPVDYQPLEDGAIYALFLKPAPQKSKPGGYRLVSETQGQFSLAKGQVHSGARGNSDPVGLKYWDASSGTFLQQIHRAVPRKNMTKK